MPRARGTPSTTKATDAWPVGREVHIVVPGKIIAWNRPIQKVTKEGKPYKYTDRRSYNYAAEVKQAASMVMGYEDPAPDDTGFVLDIVGVWPVPSSWTRPKRERALSGIVRKTTDPDVDNGIIKGTMDALEGIVYSDDGDVIYTRCLKVYGTRPRLEIWVTVAPPMTERDHPKLANKQGTQIPLRNARPPEQVTGLFAAGEGEGG